MSAIQQSAVTQTTTPGNSNYDPYFSNVSLLLAMNGSNGSTSFVDASPNQKTLAVFGNTQISTAQSKFGGSSASFDGNGDYLTIPSSTDLDISTGDFTIEAWVRLNAMPTTDTLSVWQNWMIIYERGSASASDGWQFQIGQTLLMFSDSYGTAVCSGTHGMVINTWYHLSVSRSSTTFRVFVNGVQVGTSTSSITLNSGPTYWIGTETGEGAYLNGYIDDLRITKGIARYTSNFTVPAYANPLTGPNYDPFYNNVSLLLHCNGTNASTNFIDNSGSPKTVTANGNAQISTAQWRFGGSSALFDGVNDFLTVSTASTYDWLTNSLTSWTIECWFNVPTVTGTKNLLSKGSNNTTQAAVLCNISTNTAAVSFYKSSVYGGVGSVSTNTLTANTWNHYAAVYNAIDRTLRVFLNGEMGSVVTLDVAASYSVANGAALKIGEYSTGEFDYSSYIDDFRITQDIARYTSNFTPQRVSFADSNINIDPYYDQTVLLLPMNGANASTSFIDSSKTAKIVTSAGSAAISTAQNKFGGSSLLIDALTKYLSVPNSTDVDMGSSDFTIECWVYATTWGSVSTIISKRANTGVDSPLIIYLSSGTINARFTNTGTTAYTITGSALSTSTWYHIAYTRSGNNTYLYVNGTQVGSTLAVTGSALVNTAVLTIGNEASYAASPTVSTFYIDDLRITKGVARYTSNFTVPVSPNPTTGVQYDNYYDNISLLLHMNGSNNGTSFVDSSLRAKTITVNGNAVTSTTQYKYGVSSLYLDNSGTRRGLEVLNISGTGTEDFTYEAWVYPISLTGTAGLNILFDHRIGSGHTNGMFMYISSSGNIAIYNITASSNTVTLNQWNHVAYVRASGILTYYINGISGGSQAFTRNNIDTSLYIGTPNDTTQYQWVGYLDDVRITNGIARYTANFTPPTQAFPDQGPQTDPYYYNTSLLLHFDGTNASTNFIDNSPVIKSITPSGNAQISTAQSKFGGSSVFLDGTGDYLTAPSDAAFSFGTNDFTVEGWVYYAAITNSGIFQIGASLFPGLSGIGLGLDGPTNSWLLYFGTGNQTSATTKPVVNTWYHFAVVRSSGTTKLYINGIATSISSADTNNYTGTVLGIGGIYSTGYLMNGYLDDFRITKSVARYVNNFTPPQRPFPNQ